MIPSCVGVGAARSNWLIMGSFQPTNTLLLLAATEPSSWSFHLSSMFVGMMFSGVVLAKWSLSSGDITLRAFNFNKLSISLNLDASNFSCPFPIAHHTPHHSCLSVWVPPRKIVSRYQTQQFLRLPQRSLSFVQSRRRHSRARLPVL